MQSLPSSPVSDSPATLIAFVHRIVCGESMSSLLLSTAISIAGICSVSATVQDGAQLSSEASKSICPLVKGKSWHMSLAWPLEEKIGVSATPHFNLSGPPIPREVSSKNFRGISLWQSYSKLQRPDLEHCLVCYAYPDRNMNISARLLCAEGQSGFRRVDSTHPAYLVQEFPVSAGHIHILQAKFSPKNGLTTELRGSLGGCRIMSYEIVAVTGGTLVNQCWMLPIVSEQPKLLPSPAPPLRQIPLKAAPKLSPPGAHLTRVHLSPRPKAENIASALLAKAERRRSHLGYAGPPGIPPSLFPPPTTAANIFAAKRPTFVSKFGRGSIPKQSPFRFLPNSPHARYFRNGFRWI